VLVGRTGEAGVPLVRRRVLSGEEALAWAMVAPWVVGFLLWHLGPMLASAVLSLTDWPLLASPSWVGLENYRVMFLEDPLFLQALKVTTLYAVLAVPLQIVVGVSLAVLLNQRIRALAFIRTVYYLPSCVSGVSVALVWLWIFSGDYGLINAALRLVGVAGPYWLADPGVVLIAFVVMSLWGVGASAVIYLAGLQAVPTELYDAARVDGAGDWAVLRSVTLPMISHVVFFQAVMGIIASLQTFTGPYVMTQGGPANASLFFVLYLFMNGFEFFKMGYASALAWVLFLYVLAVTALVFRSSALWVFYETEHRGAKW
jgi:multiple sugar transport system permease protein